MSTKNDELKTENNDNEIVFPIAKNKVHQGYLLSGVLAIIGFSFIFIFNTATPDALAIGVTHLIFSAFIGSMAYRSQQKSIRFLVLNDQGIWFKDWHGPLVPWTNITNIEISGSRIKSSMNIHLNDHDKILDALDPEAQKAFKKSNLVKLPVISLPNSTIDADMGTIRDLILEKIRKPAA